MYTIVCSVDPVARIQIQILWIPRYIGGINNNFDLQNSQSLFDFVQVKKLGDQVGPPCLPVTPVE